MGRDILLDHGLTPNRDAMKPPMLLSEAVEKACEEAPQDVENKIRVVGKLAMSFLVDIPVSSITLDQSYELLFTVWMLPKGWGKAHGRNRYNQEGRDLCPLQEISEADAKDAKLLEEIMRLDTLSVPDKRRRLEKELTPRPTDGNLFVQRDMLNRIFRAALGAKCVGRDVDDDERVVPSHKQLKSRQPAWHKTQNALRSSQKGFAPDAAHVENGSPKVRHGSGVIVLLRGLRPSGRTRSRGDFDRVAGVVVLERGGAEIAQG